MATNRHVVVGAALTGWVAGAAAQELPVAPAQGTIEEVIVTAQKRAQSQQDVPIAISALTAEALTNAGVQDMFDVARQVPSLGVQQNLNPLHTQFRIRGVGNFGNIPNFEPAVAYFVDGAFRARSGLALGDLVDIDRIEVLKGPQSTLYGKNSSAGVVAVYTQEPGDALSLTGEIKAGNVEGGSDAATWQAKAAVSGPVSDSIRLGLSGSYFDQDFLFDNLFTGDGSNETSRYGLRGQMTAQVSDAFKLRLIVGHRKISDSKGAGDGDFFYGAAPAAINAAFGVTCPDNDPENRRVCRNFAGETALDATEATLIGTLEFAGGYELTSLTSWDEYDMTKELDADQLNVYLFDVNDRQAGDAIQQELRIASPTGGAVDWLGGAFYYQSDFERGYRKGRDMFVVGTAGPFVPLVPGIPFGQPGNAGSLLSATETEYFGVFGQAAWHASGRFSVTAGGRWQTESNDTAVRHTVNHATPSVVTVALLPATVDADLSRDTDAFTWSVAPQYFFTDDVMGYVTASYGFKSGGFNGGWGRTLAVQREFKDEVVDHYEAGLKAMLLDRRLQLNLAAFYSDFTDFQEAGFVSLQFLVTNAPEVSAKGLELDLVTKLGESWTAELGATYAKAEFDDFTGGACYPGRAPNPATGDCDLTGEALANAPELKTHAALQYERSTSFGSLYARTDWTWTDEYFTNPNHDPRQLQSSFSLLDARAGVRFGQWDVSIWGENLFDETYVTQSLVSNLFTGDPAFQTFLGLGRSYGITARVRLQSL